MLRPMRNNPEPLHWYIYKRLWAFMNEEKVKISKRKWLKDSENLTHVREHRKLRYAQNPSRERELNKLWKINNRDKRANHKATRRAREKQNFVGDRAALNAVYTRAQGYRRWFDVAVDHIIPLAKGGAHSVENLQIIYRKENEMKNASLTFEPTTIFI